MKAFSKPILSTSDLIQSYLDRGLIIDDLEEAKQALSVVGFYRLRDYYLHIYDKKNKKFFPNTHFHTILRIYKFDMALSILLFEMIKHIEVALRSHNSRIYYRVLNHRPTLLYTNNAPTQNKTAKYRLYETVLAMKYLRPNKNSWQDFVDDLATLFDEFQDSINLSDINFPDNWKDCLKSE